MHSATPEASATRCSDGRLARLGDRGRAGRSDPSRSVVVTSPDAPRRLRRRDQSPCRRRRAARATPPRGPRQPSKASTRDVLFWTGDAATITSDAPGRAARDAPLRRTPPRRVLSFETPDPGAYGPHRAGTAGGALQGDRRSARRGASRSSRSREVNSLDLRLRDRQALAGRSNRLTPQNVQGELYLTDTVRDLVAAGERVAVHMADDPTEAEGVNTRVRARSGRGRAARPDQPTATCWPVRRSSTRSYTWIDPTVALEPDCTIQPSRSCAAARASPLGRRSAHTWVAVDGGDRLRHAGLAPFCYLSPRNGAGDGREGRRVRGDQELAHRGTNESAPPVVHRRQRRSVRYTNIAAGNITVNFPSSARPSRKAGRRSGATSGPGVHNAFVAGP